MRSITKLLWPSSPIATASAGALALIKHTMKTSRPTDATTSWLLSLEGTPSLQPFHIYQLGGSSFYYTSFSSPISFLLSFSSSFFIFSAAIAKEYLQISTFFKFHHLQELFPVSAMSAAEYVYDTGVQLLHRRVRAGLNQSELVKEWSGVVRRQRLFVGSMLPIPAFYICLFKGKWGDLSDLESLPCRRGEVAPPVTSYAPSPLPTKPASSAASSVSLCY